MNEKTEKTKIEMPEGTEGQQPQYPGDKELTPKDSDKTTIIPLVR